MKKLLIFTWLLAMSLACTRKEAGQWIISAETLPVPELAGTDDRIEVTYPVVSGVSFADSVNARIETALKTSLGLEEDSLSVEEAIRVYLQEREADSILRRLPMEFMADFEEGSFAGLRSVRLYTYYYLGGAHGLSTGTSLTFDEETGAVLAPETLFDTAALRRINIGAFIREVEERSGERIEDQVLFVDVNQLPLPMNMTPDSMGLHMYYNPYEIAPYAFGATEYVIPIDSLQGLWRWEKMQNK